MPLFRLILREIAFRKLNFALGVLVLAAAVACFSGSMALLRSHDLTTDNIIAARQAESRRIIAARQAESQRLMRQFEDDTRKSTLKLGFNMMILPHGQKLSELYMLGAQPRFMEESYAQKLADSRVATINHVLPSLVARVKWPERQTDATLMGVHGEVYIQSSGQKPLLEPVPAGSIVLGHDLHAGTDIKPGGTVTFMDRGFKVARLLDQRDPMDDGTVWINLADAQELLGRKGLINCILALECACEPDRLAGIRAEVQKILPDTDVVEFKSQAITRSEMRLNAARTAQDTLDRQRQAAQDTVTREQQSRMQLRQGREALMAVLVPGVAAAAALCIAGLSFLNVRERRQEIGILRALGVRMWQVLTVFMGKALVVGLIGGVMGLAVGLAAPMVWHEQIVPKLGQLVSLRLVLIALASAPAIAMLAGWVPALLASQQDPALVLQEE